MKLSYQHRPVSRDSPNSAYVGGSISFNSYGSILLLASGNLLPAAKYEVQGGDGAIRSHKIAGMVSIFALFPLKVMKIGLGGDMVWYGARR